MAPSYGVLPPVGKIKQAGLTLRALAGEELRRPETHNWKVSDRAALHASDLGKEEVEYLYPDPDRGQLQGPPLSATAKRFGYRRYSASATMAAQQPGTIDHAFSGGDLARGPQHKMNHSLRESLPPVARRNRALAHLLNEHDVRSRELDKLQAELLKRRNEEAHQRRDYHKQADRRNSDASIQLADEIRDLESQIFQREMITMQLKRDIEDQRRGSSLTPRTLRQPSVAASGAGLDDTGGVPECPLQAPLSARPTAQAPLSTRTTAKAPLSARPTAQAPLWAEATKAPLSARTLKVHLDACTMDAPAREFGPSLVAQARKQAEKQIVLESSTAEPYHISLKPPAGERTLHQPVGFAAQLDVACNEDYKICGEVLLL
eukprot:TRINITY_DN21989_c0_g1_i1.p1 TRINITY_DN21989_c0_g1~~TRINITY_DN21989_c0_g1_i1.p1  ORF type:complete len:376 (-),score=53.82 TRINITY_DN21989_c0_g1_i1:63-1190(-)